MLAINLETQDYKALGFCQPPVMDQYYSIGLIFHISIPLTDQNATVRILIFDGPETMKKQVVLVVHL